MTSARRAQSSLETVLVLAALSAFLAVLLPASLQYQAALDDTAALTQAKHLAVKLDATVLAVGSLGPGAKARVDAFVRAPVTLQTSNSSNAELTVQTKTLSRKKLALAPSTPAPSSPLEWSNATNRVQIDVENQDGTVVLSRAIG